MSQSTVERVSFFSKSLRKTMPALVYLPPQHGQNVLLPVLYFLHGRNGNETILIEAEIKKTADQMMSSGRIKPMVIVCPRMENSRGLNSSPDCKAVPDPENPMRMIHMGLYEDYMIKDFIPFIEDTFHVRKDKSGRSIGGASAGGYAALRYAFRYPQLFAQAGGHMPALELALQPEDMPYYSELADWDACDPIMIARSDMSSRYPDIYLDAGEQDEGGFYEGCCILHELLKKRGTTSQNHQYPGNHSLSYIKANFEKYLDFYGG